jgi:hypothetical protein
MMKIPRPPASPAAMHFATTPSKTRRKASHSMPCAAEHRRVGDTVLNAELAEPAIGKVHLHLGAVLPRDANQREQDDTRDRPRVSQRCLSAKRLPRALRAPGGPPRWLPPTLPSPSCSPSPRPAAGNRDPATVSSVQNPVAAELIEGIERMKARTFAPDRLGRASRMSDWRNLPCRSEMCTPIFTR